MFKENGLGYFEQCLSSDKTALKLFTAVDTYDFCEGMTADKLVEPVPVVSFDGDSGD